MHGLFLNETKKWGQSVEFFLKRGATKIMFFRHNLNTATDAQPEVDVPYTSAMLKSKLPQFASFSKLNELLNIQQDVLITKSRNIEGLQCIQRQLKFYRIYLAEGTWP